MGLLNDGGICEIGDGLSDLNELEIGAGGEIELVAGGLKQVFSGGS